MKQALISVVQLWLDRLQHQAVVVSAQSLRSNTVVIEELHAPSVQTTFFVSIDSLLFSVTSSTRSSNFDDWSKSDLVINAGLGGAIIFHVCACKYSSLPLSSHPPLYGSLQAYILFPKLDLYETASI